MLFSLLASCGSNDVIRPENAHNYKNCDVIVYVKDGTKIFFKNGNYDVKETSEGRTISGKGTLLSDSVASNQLEFNGDIRLSNIDKIVIAERQSEMSLFANTSIIIALTAGVTYLLLVAVFHVGFGAH